LKAYCAALDVRNAYLASNLVAVVRALEDRGVRALAFKGPTLAAFYAAPSRRSYGDLDVLISRQDVLAAEATLAELGFRLEPPYTRREQVAFVGQLTGWRRLQYLESRSEHDFRRDDGRILVDLHLAVADPFIRVPLRFDDLFARSERLSIAGESLRVPCAGDMLLILSVNAAKDCFARLQHLRDFADVARTHPEMDWETVFNRANRLGVRRMLEVTLWLTEQVAGIRLTGSEPDARARRVAASAVTRMTAEASRPPLLSLAYTRLQLQIRERLFDRLWYCLHLVLTPGPSDWMFIPLPHELGRAYPMVRAIRLMLNLLRRSLAGVAAVTRPVRAGHPRPG
jgi:hypothetical protein